ncbi:MAG: CPBP family intramembrane glutamic endopeptidase [Pseudomonadota bacterium]
MSTTIDAAPPPLPNAAQSVDAGADPARKKRSTAHVDPARPARGKLFWIDPVLVHARTGLFDAPWWRRLIWFVLALILGGLLWMASSIAIYLAAYAVATWRDEVSAIESAIQMTDLAPGNGYGFLVLALIGIGFAIPAFIIGRVFFGAWSTPFHWRAPFRGYDFVKAGTAYALLLAAGIAYGVATRPELYAATSILTDPPSAYALWFALGLLAILVQSGGEELMFRGILPRLVGMLIPIRVIAVGLVMVFFISMHTTNEDFRQDVYFNVILFAVLEIFAFTVLFRTRSIAATWAMHWVNNSLIFLMIATEPGRVSTMVPFVYTDPVWSAGGSYLTNPVTYLEFGVGVAILAAMLFWRRSPFYLPWHDERA